MAQWLIGEGARPQGRDIEGPFNGGRRMARREFLRGLAAAGAAGVLASVLGPTRRAGAGPAPGPMFPDGVKAGDPHPSGGVIWSRLQPPVDDLPVAVMWTIATDPAMNDVVQGGITEARAEDGYCIKRRVRRLRDDSWYYYRFEAGGEMGPVGRLRTAPKHGATPDRLRYGFASCQQRTASHYVAHRAMANDNLDFHMHLGDYIYVSDSGTITLDDYRTRWRTFHSNPLLQDLQANVPIVPMFDDGEFYNGVDATGDPVRLAAARKAWFENMPVEPRGGERAYRAFSWGRLADVIMIDVRTYRDPEVPANADVLGVIDAQDSRIAPGEQMFAEGRTTLGHRQLGWLKRRLRRRRPTWRMVGNPYNMNPWRIVDLDTPEERESNPDFQRNAGVYVSNEAWDDYQAERRTLLEYIERRNIPNVVFTSGHTHFYLASELQPDFDDATSPTVAFDFVTGSQTADPDPTTIAPVDVLLAVEQIFLENNNPYMRYVNLLDQGYAVVDITPDEIEVAFRVIDTYDPDAVARTAARFRVVSGSSTMEVLPGDPP